MAGEGSSNLASFLVPLGKGDMQVVHRMVLQLPAVPSNLLEMQILRLQPRPTESDTGVRTGVGAPVCFKEPSGIRCLQRYEDHLRPGLGGRER